MAAAGRRCLRRASGARVRWTVKYSATITLTTIEAHPLAS